MKGMAKLLLLGVAFSQLAAADKAARKGGGSSQPVQTSKCNEVPAHPFDLILGRPTANSVTVSVLCYEDAEGCIVYGSEAGKLALKTPERPFKKGEPAEIVLAGLQPASAYLYQLRLAHAKSTELPFHTARPPASSFSFTITADSHLDEHTESAIYQKTLAHALADKPDFHVDLGDTFMSEKHVDRTAAAQQYLAQRYYFSQLCQAAPLFCVLGNHDGETPRGRGRDAEGLAVWSSMMRKRYFPNPLPDAFYTGDAEKHPEAGLLQDYYAWQWGDALCIVLDPFWFTRQQRGKNDNWSRSLGDTQYLWLKHTLETSHAKFKFVFIHHLVGGADEQCRGGAEAAPFYEWGGKNADGSDGFKQNRPAWPTPIHQLLVQNKVSIVFHGHDHFYAKQGLDGIIYQEVPQPGYSGNGKAPRSAAEYGYKSGTILGSSGYMRVLVGATKAKVEFVRTIMSTSDEGSNPREVIADSYQIP